MHLFGLGLSLGLALGLVVSSYAKADPAAPWEAAGSMAGFVAVLGTNGYATPATCPFSSSVASASRGALPR
jgi:hypothetical protein